MKFRTFTFLLSFSLAFILTYTGRYTLINEAQARPAESAVLLARGTSGMQTWKFDTATDTWIQQVAQSPRWSDELGWDSVDNYSTIQAADVDGDGQDELLARANRGMLTWKYNPATNTWRELVANSPRWSDDLGWDSVDNYSTIQTANIDEDSGAELLARGTNGMQTWKFNPATNTWHELVANSPRWSDDLGWDGVDNYSTIQTANIDEDSGAELLARGTNGMQTWKFNPATNTWYELVANSPRWSDDLGWDSVDNYSTIQAADVDGDGQAELLARGTNGMQTWKFNTATNTWYELVASSPQWSDALGWDDVDNYSTIQAADIDGDGAAELLARGTNGMQTWKFNQVTDTWEELTANSPQWSDALGWDGVDNYSTIQAANIDEDSGAELLARGTNGMQTWKFNTATNTWYELVASSPQWSDALGWDSVDNYSTIQTANIQSAPDPSFNVQIQAIEVTQGIRGDIPTRTAPGDDLVFIPDTAVHVANRRTIVRVYPWVTNPPGSPPIPPVTVRLSANRDGISLPDSPLSPENRFITPVVGESVQAMRFDAAKSWNFVLPDSWVSEGTIYLNITVNPTGDDYQPECPGCEEDNTAYLGGTRFVQVQEQTIRVDMHLIDFYWREADGTVQHRPVSGREIAEILDWWQKNWPLRNRVMQLRWRWHRMSHDFYFDPVENRIKGRPVDPPIPGVPDWDVLLPVLRDQYPGIGGPPNPYYYLPMIISRHTPHGCGGGAAIGKFDVFSAGACRSVLTHEASHTIGREHSDTLHLINHPQDNGAMETNAVGFDIYELRAIPPYDGSPSNHTHDYMSYGSPPKWTSLYSWEGIADAFGATLIDPTRAMPDQATGRAYAQEDYLRISGKIIEGNTVSFDPFFRLSRTAGSNNQAGQGSYRIELRDANQAALFTRFFEPSIHLSSDEEVDFYELLPVIAGMTDIVLLKDGQVLGTQAVSSGSPQVQLLSPVDGQTWAASGEATVEWSGSDPDGDPLLYRLEGSPDGETWFILVSATAENRATLDLATIPGSGNWQIRVQASDGVHTAFDEASSVNIAPKAPQPLIEIPLAGQVFGPDQLITLQGQAFDWQEDDLTGTALTWHMDGSQVGTGQAVQLSDVAEGQHMLELRATNSTGLTGTMSISFWVGEGPPTIYLPLILK